MRIVGDQAPEISAGILGEKKSPRLQSKMKYLWDRVWLWAGPVSQDIFNLVLRHDLFAHQCRAYTTRSNSEVLDVMLHRFLECQPQQPQGIGDICALSEIWSFIMIHVDRSLSNLLLLLIYSQWNSSAIPVFIRRFSGYAISQNGGWPLLKLKIWANRSQFLSTIALKSSIILVARAQDCKLANSTDVGYVRPLPCLARPESATCPRQVTKPRFTGDEEQDAVEV
jgi:hypothetical protein